MLPLAVACVRSGRLWSTTAIPVTAGGEQLLVVGVHTTMQ
jgi:hypothetical protein